MQRNQCVALCFIFLLAGAEAARTVETANAMNALALHGGQRSNEFKDTMSDDVVLGGSAVAPPTDSLMSHLGALNSSTQVVLDGKGLFGVKYCMFSCVVTWVRIIYHSWMARSDAKKVVADSFAAQKELTMLPSVSESLADTFRGTMRKTVGTFLKVIDNSIVQRVLLSLFFAPLGLFRSLTKMSPLGLCFLKEAWKDLEANEDYKQKHTTWWSFFLMGCAAPAAQKATSAFEDDVSTDSLVDAMVYAVTKPGGFDMPEQAARWNQASTHVQCVMKQSRKGEWSKRRILIERGVMSWAADSMCRDVGILDQVRDFFGQRKSFSLEFLTKPVGGQAVQLVNNSQCMGFQNPYRQFMLCAEPGYTMEKAKAVMDEHLSILGGEHELLQMTAKVERLVAASLKDEVHDEEIKELTDSMDASGDSSVEDLPSKIGTLPESEAPEAVTAKKILAKVKQGSSLLEAGDHHAGGSLLQEAYAAAQGHEMLSDLMHGKRAFAGLEVRNPGAAAAGGGGSISTTELLIILAVCGFGALCIGVGLMLAQSNLEEESKVLPWNNATQVLPLPPVA